MQINYHLEGYSRLLSSTLMSTGSTSLATHCRRPLQAGAESPDPQFTPLLMKDDTTEAQSGEPHPPGHPHLTLGSSPTFPHQYYVHQTRLFFFTSETHILILNL